jgi:hypothetical protein
MRWASPSTIAVFPTQLRPGYSWCDGKGSERAVQFRLRVRLVDQVCRWKRLR